MTECHNNKITKSRSKTDQCIRTFKTLPFTEVLLKCITIAYLTLVDRLREGTLNFEKVAHAGFRSARLFNFMVVVY